MFDADASVRAAKAATLALCCHVSAQELGKVKAHLAPRLLDELWVDVPRSSVTSSSLTTAGR